VENPVEKRFKSG